MILKYNMHLYPVIIESLMRLCDRAIHLDIHLLLV